MGTKRTTPRTGSGPPLPARSSAKAVRARPPLTRALHRLLSGYAAQIEGPPAGPLRPPEEIRVVARVMVNGISYVLCRYQNSFQKLTPREKQVTLLLLSGLSSKEVATRLQITNGTVKENLKRIYSKLAIDSRTGLVRSCFLETPT